MGALSVSCCFMSWGVRMLLLDALFTVAVSRCTNSGSEGRRTWSFFGLLLVHRSPASC